MACSFAPPKKVGAAPPVPGASVCFWSVYIRQARRRRRVAGLKAASARLIRHLAYVAGVHAVAGRRAESRISHLSSRPAHNDNALLSYSYGDGDGGRFVRLMCVPRDGLRSRAFVSDTELSCAGLICRCSLLTDVALDPSSTRLHFFLPPDRTRVHRSVFFVDDQSASNRNTSVVLSVHFTWPSRERRSWFLPRFSRTSIILTFRCGVVFRALTCDPVAISQSRSDPMQVMHTRASGHQAV